jgi:uncharacterized repeat protein (TIGR01451 family)
MWLASLRRLVAGNSHSRKERRRLAARSRKPVRLRLETLEERLTPSGGQTAGSYPALTAAIAADTAANTNYVIQITNSFTFNSGGQVSISKLGAGSTLTIEGQNGTNYTLSGNGNRLFFIAKGQTVSLENLTLTGGVVSGSAAKGGAVYNSGNLSMKSVVVAGNQALGGNGQNAAGGGIYSSGGSLTLSHDVIGRSVSKSHTRSLNLTTYTSKTAHATHTVGASNKATSGTGGSAQGGGLYVAGGTVNVSSCTIAGNQVSGSVSAQGGGLYVSGVSQLNLSNTIIGRQSVHTATLYPIGVTKTSQATAFSSATKMTGSANKVTGGSAMGGGLYVSGGVVKVSGGAIGSNQAAGGASQNAAGGGVYAVGATLTFNTVAFPNNQVFGGAATAVGVSGGNAQGGGLFISGGSATLSNSHVSNNTYNVRGGNGGKTTSEHNHAVGGGNGGNAQGGGIFALNTTLTLTNGTVLNGNEAAGGDGGNGTIHHLNAFNGGFAQGGGVYASASTVIIEEGSTLYNNFAGGGSGGKGGNAFTSARYATVGQKGATTGGQGGNGGFAQGGGLYANGGSVTLAGTNNSSNNTSVVFNDASGGYGGAGGNGGAGVAYGHSGGVGGAGGAGGNAYGGGLYVNNAPLTVSGGASLLQNTATCGPGGQGGQGGGGWVNYTVNKLNLSTNSNSGYGGNGGQGGQGGQGGTAQGGGLYAVGSGLTITLGDAAGGIVMKSNNAFGGFGAGGGAGGGTERVFQGTTFKSTKFIYGKGGNGGNGGDAEGGGAAIFGDKLVLTNATIQKNGVLGLPGGTTKGYDSSTPGGTTIRKGGGASAAGGSGGSGQGGGLFISSSSSVLILNSTLADNNANYEDEGGNGGNGGNGGELQYSYIGYKEHGGNGGNAGTQQGGGLYATASTVSILNSTVADNALWDSLGGKGGTGSQGSGTTGANGPSQGSGIFAAKGSLSLTNDTIAWNFLHSTSGAALPSDLGAGIYNDPTNSLVLQNTIVALNQIYNAATSSSAMSDLYGAASVSSGNNLIGDGSGSSGLSNGVNGNQVGSDASAINPLFSAPAPTGPGQGQEPGNYGGPTPTLPLDGKSPALNAGDPSAASIIAQYENGGLAPATDQRGLPRLVNGAIDIGATEDQVIFTGSPSVTSVQEGGTITYTLTVTNGEGAPIDVTLTDVIPADTSYDPGSASGTGWTITGPSASNNNTLTATTTLDPGATATLTFSVTVAPNAGNTTIHNSASINWTGNDASGTPSVLMNTTVTGGQSSTTTSLTSSANPAQYGQPVTFTAVVRASSGTPTGTVTFEDGNTVLGTAALDYNGVATFTISTLSLGSHSITAVYSGDSNDLGSTSNAVSLTINQDSTTTTLTSSANPAVYGQPVTFTATVSSLYSTPTGTVTFEDGNTILGTAALNGDPVATFTISTLSLGSHSITAVYSGDSDDLGSTSNAISQAVNQDSTTVALTSSVNPSVYGQPVTFTATVSVVSPGAGTPTGNVDFVDVTTGTDLGTVALSSNGTASITVSNLAAGPQVIKAIYSGDTDDLGNSGTLSTPQQVDYNFHFLPPLSLGLHYEVNRTIPITFLLTNYNGCPITSLSAVTSLQIQALDASGNPIGAPFTPASTNKQGLQNILGVYLYLWQTKGLAAGPYEIEVKLADGVTHTTTIQLVANGRGANAQTTDGSDVSDGATAGQLLGGNVGLYVDNSNGALTPDELARIQDAVNAVDTTIAPYGVAINEVTDPTQADVTLHMGTTSAVGGFAQGVLGCYTTTGTITLIQGWNWYAGSDPTQIGANQYDFQTTVTHELGHALGLGESADAASAMYGTLAPGTTLRTLTPTDLNVPYDEGYADSQRAALPPGGAIAGTTAGNNSTSGQGMTPPIHMNVPSSDSPLSITDQLFADLSLLLNEVMNAYQSQLASLLSLWQQVDARVLQPFDALLNVEAAAMGTFPDAPILALLSTDRSA